MDDWKVIAIHAVKFTRSAAVCLRTRSLWRLSVRRSGGFRDFHDAKREKRISLPLYLVTVPILSMNKPTAIPDISRAARRQPETFRRRKIQEVLREYDYATVALYG